MSIDSSPINPYQPLEPPHADSTDSQWKIPAELDELRVIRFEGRVTERDVEDLLSLTATQGLNWLLVLPVIFGSLTVLMNASWPWIMAAVGVAMLFLVMVSLLSRSYRRADFYAFNPVWDESARGSVSRHGYEIDSPSLCGAATWSGVANAFVGDTVVAFQSALGASKYRIIPRHTVATDEDWAVLRQLAEINSLPATEKRKVDTRIRKARELSQDANRPQLQATPDDAIPFSGTITGKDIRPFRASPAQRQLYYRAVFYLSVAMIGLSAILTGASCGVVMSSLPVEIPPTRAFLTVTLVVATVGGFLLTRYFREQGRPDRVHFVQIGFATENGITFDDGCAIRKTIWPHWRPVLQAEDRILMTECNFQWYCTLRSDMFQSETDWQRFQSFANAGLGSPPSSDPNDRP